MKISLSEKKIKEILAREYKTSPDKVKLFRTGAVWANVKLPEPAYKPTCPRGYDDCVGDPAYIKAYHPEWYKELYGDKTPKEVSKEKCVPRIEEDPDEELFCYDDEDK